MTRNFARHEQFLRIFSLLDILSAARQPLDDQALIAAVRERLGLSRLSPRTLRRDCEFLASCGYAVDHKPIVGSRKLGWQISPQAVGNRRIPDEPITLLELVAFSVSRDLLGDFEGTVLWTGIESLRHKLERSLPAGLLAQLEDAKRVFHVRPVTATRYASRPRLLSTLTAAITDGREIDVEPDPAAGGAADRRRLRPHCIVIHPPRVQLIAFAADDTAAAAPLVIDIEAIEKVTPADTTFARRELDIAALLREHGRA